MVEPLVGELRTFIKVDHMDELRKMIKHEIQEAVRKQLGNSVSNIKLLADEVRNMHLLRAKDQLDIAQLKFQNHQVLPIQMMTGGSIPQYMSNATFTPNVSPMWMRLGMDIAGGQGAGSEAMNKRS